MSVHIDDTQIDEKKGSLLDAIGRWLRDLAALAPEAMLRKRRKRLILLKSADGLQVHYARPDGTQHLWTCKDRGGQQETLQLKTLLAKWCNRRTDLILRLSSGHALQRKITLPQAAFDVLEPVVANQIDQIMPWPQNDTVFGYAVDARHGRDGQISVTVAATSKEILNDALRQLGEYDAIPDFVDHGDDATAQDCIKLAGDADGARTRFARGIGICLGILLLASLAIGSTGLVPMVGQQLMLNDLHAQADRKHRKLSTIDARNELSRKLRRQAGEIINRKTSRPAVTIVLEMLSRAVPDGAWLTDLAVRDDKMQLRGKATNASGLIATLEELPYFKDVQFSAPTTRKKKEAQETFAISAGILPVARLDLSAKSLRACCKQRKPKDSRAPHLREVN